MYELWINGNSGYYVFNPNTLIRFENDSALYHGIQGKKLFRTNENGFRGEDSTKDQREILFVGGSTTLCSQLDNKETWPYLTAEKLSNHSSQKYNSIIAAKGGLFSEHFPLFLDKAFDSDSRIEYVVIMPGANDLEVWTKNESYMKYDKELLELTAFEILPLVSDYFLLGSYDFQWSNLLIVKNLRKLKYRVFSKLGISQVQTGGEASPGRQRDWRSSAVKMEPNQSKLESLGLYLKNFRRNLQACIDICRKHNVEIVLVSQPMMYSENMSDTHRRLWRNGAINASYHAPKPETPYLTESAMFRTLSEFNQAAKETAIRDDVFFIDLADQITGEPELYWDQWHFNEAGAKIAAEFISMEMSHLMKGEVH